MEVAANLYDLDMERAILSALIQDDEAYSEIGDMIGVGDFYFKPHADVYEAITKCVAHDEPIAPSFIKKWLEGRYNEQIFAEILATSGLIDARKYANELKEKSIKRGLNSIAHRTPTIVNETQKAKEAADKISAEIYKLIDEEKHGGVKTSPEIITEVVSELRKQKEQAGSELVGLDTGFTYLNKFTKGYKPGELIIIAARPGMGKTAFVLNSMLKTLEKGKGVVFFSLEMPAVQIMYRMLSIGSSVPLNSILSATLSDDDWSRFNAECERMMDLPLFVYDSGHVNIQQVRTQMRKLKAAHENIELCVVDYIGLMTSTSNFSERHLQIAEISRGLKLLARELNIPIIALSQLNRGVELRSDKRPQMADLRESGAIEQDADIILFVYRDEVYKERAYREKRAALEMAGKDPSEIEEFKRNELEEKAEIIIGKNRSGEAGRTIEVAFQGPYTRFVDLVSFGGAPMESSEFEMTPDMTPDFAEAMPMVGEISLENGAGAPNTAPEFAPNFAPQGAGDTAPNFAQESESGEFIETGADEIMQSVDVPSQSVDIESFAIPDTNMANVLKQGAYTQNQSQGEELFGDENASENDENPVDI
ncbi:replicative DNA helicase [Campylobacter sp. VBCF_05 NA6]|nr:MULTISPECIES: replicative DNA helicase [unclassified Campylobacter]MDA3057652.1 replicative DNA helicase [Campylobacter sp. VBCF_04 NA7]MDA3058553.1 replicative DNA helicase [Campylobacter sp. VBCF_05 NA6]